MKKIAVSVLSMLMALITVLGLAGCGNSNEEQLLKSYIMNSEEFTEQVKNMQEDTYGGATVSVQVEGRKLIFLMRSTKQLDELNANDLKDRYVNAASEFEKSEIGNMTVSDLILDIRTKTTIQYPMIGFECYNLDGSAIVKLEYDSQTMQTKLI